MSRTRVVGLSGNVTERQGYRVETESRGATYFTELRRVDPDEEEDGQVAVEVVGRWKVEDGEREELDDDATGAVKRALQERDVEVV